VYRKDRGSDVPVRNSAARHGDIKKSGVVAPHILHPEMKLNDQIHASATTLRLSHSCALRSDSLMLLLLL
jgi:hypothetical protein